MKLNKKMICTLLALLTLTTVFTFSACKKNEADLTQTNTTFNNVNPTKKPATTKADSLDIPTTTKKEKETQKDTSKHENTTKVTQPSTKATTKPTTTKENTTKKEKVVTTKKETTTSKAWPTTSPSTMVQTTTKREKPTRIETEKVETTKKIYSCGKKSHSCNSLEVHKFITELEARGCPTCKSHSCKSFYSVDEWGNSCYDQTRCPEYSIKKDNIIYCRVCGKANGTGDNNTCVRFTVDTTCPICKAPVAAKTCHTH